MPQDLRVLSAASSPQVGGAGHGGGWSNVLMPLPRLDSGNCKGCRRTRCPHNGLFWGSFPTVLTSDRGGGAAAWPRLLSVGGRQIGWHRSRRHARLAGGSWGRGPVPTCAAASRPSQGQGVSLEGGGAGCPCRRAEHGCDPAALAVSPHPSTEAPVVLIAARGTLISVFPSSKCWCLYFKRPLPKVMSSWLGMSFLI